jgi:hypothetical protein
VKSTNQGFVDLHTPAGFFLIGASFIVFTLLIVAGGILSKRIAAREKEERRKLKESLGPKSG